MSGPPTGWPYEVHPDTPPTQRVFVMGPRACEWLNVGPSHMEGDCIVALCRNDTGTQYHAVQSPVVPEATNGVMPTITEGWHPIAYVKLLRCAGAVLRSNITMVEQPDTPTTPS